MSLRVIQWATGNVGKRGLAAMLTRANLSVVGACVTSPAKHGRDVGELAGLKPIGVAATSDRQAILSLDADVVIHTPLPSALIGPRPQADLDDICALLESGKNVITTVGYLYPKAYGQEVYDRLQTACAKGKSSLHGTGFNPGLMGDLLPLALTGMMDRIDVLSVREINDFSSYASPEIVFGLMGMGKSDADFAAHIGAYKAWLDLLFRENIVLLADGLGAELDRIDTEVQIAPAAHDLASAAGPIAKGGVAGQRWIWSGIVGGRARIVHETVWRMHADVAPDWPMGASSIRISGAPRVKLALAADWVADQLTATALHAVNAIEAVVAAPPGVRTVLDLPLITGRGALS